MHLQELSAVLCVLTHGSNGVEHHKISKQDQRYRLAFSEASMDMVSCLGMGLGRILEDLRADEHLSLCARSMELGSTKKKRTGL